jgi:hypothetical protein
MIDPLSKDYVFKDQIPFQNNDGDTIYHVFLNSYSGYRKFPVFLTCFDRLDKVLLKEHDIFSMKNKKGQTILDLLCEKIKSTTHFYYRKYYKKLLTLFKYDLEKDEQKIEEFYKQKDKEEAEKKSKWAATNKNKYSYGYGYGY